jgi:hypothetical protein
MLNGVRDRLTFANVVSVLALFVALSGGAYALQGRNTVDSGDIKKNAVKEPELAKNAVSGGEVKNDALNGSDVNEATFGQVPSAQDADRLDGRSSDAFLGANVLLSFRRVLNDPNPGDAFGEAFALLDTPELRVFIRCDENSPAASDGGDIASVSVATGAPPSDPISVSAWETDGSATNSERNPTGIGILDLRSANNEIRSVYFVATGPNNKVVSGSISAEVTDAEGSGGDCTFAGNLITP